MNTLTDKQRGFLGLVMRSPDAGDRWRQCSATVWPLVVGFEHQDLLELDPGKKMVRMSPSGETVFRYL